MENEARGFRHPGAPAYGKGERGRREEEEWESVYSYAAVPSPEKEPRQARRPLLQLHRYPSNLPSSSLSLEDYASVSRRVATSKPVLVVKPPPTRPPPPPPPDGGLRTRLASLERENRQLMSNQGALVQETNKRLQSQTEELRRLKEENARLAGENAELRDLCVYLDDDRQKTKRLSREWQRFGRYTAGVMKDEVAAYRAKLAELEQRQEGLVRENAEMKQLCLFLDEQRAKDDAGHCLGLLALDTPKRPGPTDAQPKRLDFQDKSPKEGSLDGGSSVDDAIGASFASSSASLPQSSPTEDGSKSSQVLDYITSLERRVAQLESASSTSNISMASSGTSTDGDKVTIRLRANSQPLITSTESGASTVFGSSEGGGTGEEEEGLEEEGEGLAEDEGFAPSEESPSPANSTLTPIAEVCEDALSSSAASESGGSSSSDDVPHVSPARLRRRSGLAETSLLSSSDPTLNHSGLGGAGPAEEWSPLARTASESLVLKEESSEAVWTSVSSQGRCLSEALKVLELQERSAQQADTATEKAIIHQMCKVVWKTLDEENEQKSREVGAETSRTVL